MCDGRPSSTLRRVGGILLVVRGRSVRRRSYCGSLEEIQKTLLSWGGHPLRLVEEVSRALSSRLVAAVVLSPTSLQMFVDGEG